TQPHASNLPRAGPRVQKPRAGRSAKILPTDDSPSRNAIVWYRIGQPNAHRISRIAVAFALKGRNVTYKKIAGEGAGGASCGEEMRLSAFNQYVVDYPEPGQTLVYNTFSGGFASLDASTFALLKKADAGGMLDDSERQFIEPELSDLFDDSVGILVESRAAEERAFRAWMERTRSDTTKVTATVSITFACNFDCTYCCQADVLNGRMMNAATGAATASWLADRALAIGAREIRLNFVGGEPLLHPDRIEQIIADIRTRTEH